MVCERQALVGAAGSEPLEIIDGRDMGSRANSGHDLAGGGQFFSELRKVPSCDESTAHQALMISMNGTSRVEGGLSMGWDKIRL